MIFADLSLARRLERAEAQAGKEFAEARARLQPESGAAWMECAGANCIFDGPESPVTQTFGLGLFEDLSAASLDKIERFFFDCGAPVMHEVSPLAGISTIDLLCARSYRPIELSSVMYQPIAEAAPQSPVGIIVRLASPQDASLWADLSARGWASDYPEMEDAIRQFGALAFNRQSTVNFLAEFQGVPGATGSLCLYEDIALFGGASTIPELRRNGLQAALLSARMIYARENGHELAMMVTAAGSQSQRNAERTGFKIAYTRTKWKLTAGG
jgi:hypothetical protein